MHTNRVAIVTGRSRGIGAATVRLLARQGYAICINFRSNEQAANDVLREIVEGGRKAIV